MMNIKKAGGLLIHDRKVMLERHGGKDTYIIPGGKLEEGETAREALVRELMEEFRISVLEEDLEYVGVFTAQAVHNPARLVSMETFFVKNWQGEITLAGGIEGIIWVTSQTAKKIRLSSIAEKNILPMLLHKGLID